MVRKQIQVARAAKVARKQEEVPALTRRTINPEALNASPDAPAPEVVDSDARVTVKIPKNYSLTLENHQQVHYKAGIDEMPLNHAEHWYSKAMGVEVYDPADPQD